MEILGGGDGRAIWVKNPRRLTIREIHSLALLSSVHITILPMILKQETFESFQRLQARRGRRQRVLSGHHEGTG